jgi:hypothetical protein
MENNARKYHWVVIILLVIWIIGGAYLDIPVDTRSPIPVIPVHSIINNFH